MITRIQWGLNHVRKGSPLMVLQGVDPAQWPSLNARKLPIWFGK